MTILPALRYLPLSVLRAAAQAVAWWLKRSPHKSMLWKTRVNIALAYPERTDQQQEQLARQSIEEQCLSYVESLKCWAMPAAWSVAQIRHVEHLERLTTALKNPNGALIITPHLGVWEMMNAWVHQYGTPTILYKPMQNPHINAFVLQARQRLHAQLVATDASGVKALFKTLKQGGFGVILPDHVPQPSGGIDAAFFGVETLSSTLASKMAQKTRCALIGLSCFRREDGQGFDVYCDALNDAALYDSDLQTATTALNHAIEHMIVRNAASYMWGYKRFKHIAAHDDVYALEIEHIRQWRRKLL
ncbi:lysophospholipid acyltransferase family protein [Acinetobacter larvae]|uniref:Lipid A biosynthesis acyltransferase n=1 Tax=Acinetobacter larvae TaxID=1789224 RepID=A0A1B2M1Z2_9GAMM|nr:lysophospholipid acyltransferase family protein [Acinetobacter larvae]AOA59216.1 lipid A biosynthesis acyltransferase [Acinetobacter larvae]